ncbi:MAG: hypothetical protein JSR77_13310 [Planctomycetes bacterium]|nr:hypothetical protein [Planctomycetota bacterium]
MNFVLIPVLAVVVLFCVVGLPRVPGWWRRINVMPTPTKNSDLLRTLLSREDVTCPGCGYSLRGVTGDNCPECGLALDVVVGPGEPHRFLMRLVMGAAAVIIASSLVWILRTAYQLMQMPSGMTPPPYSLWRYMIQSIVLSGVYLWIGVLAMRHVRKSPPLNWKHPACLLIITVLAGMLINLLMTLLSMLFGVNF